MEHRILKMKNAKVREEGGRRYLEGYFAVFNEPYQVFDGWVETIERGAFAPVSIYRGGHKGAMEP